MDTTEPIPITVYTRPGCTLCLEAMEAIDRAAAAVDIEVRIQEVNVDRDADLAREYGDRLPCVFLGDELLFELRVDEYGLMRRLREVAERN